MSRFFVPEVIQTSAMDCGPAVLKAALEGFGVSVHLGELRAACQTEVDGTSIDTLEDLARQLGLSPVQTLLPEAHLDLPACLSLPAIVVTEQADGARHFMLVWRRLGAWFQIMDPSSGRRWVRLPELRAKLYHHKMLVSEALAGQWAASSSVHPGITRRLEQLGAGGHLEAVADFAGLSVLCQSLHVVEELRAAGAVSPGAAARGLLDALAATPEMRHGAPMLLSPAINQEVVIEGAVVLSLSAPTERPRPAGRLARALDVPTTSTTTQLAALLREVAPGILPAGLAVAGVGAIGGVAQAALMRALIDASRWLPVPLSRAGGMAALLGLSALVVALSWAWGAVLARAARQLELRLRARFHARLPLLDLRYFTSRLQSDLAERAHALSVLNGLPAALSRVLQSVAGLAAALLGIVWLDPSLAWIVGLSLVVCAAMPALLHPLLASRELRRQTFDGALSRTYLDAMLGASPIRAHGGQEAVRRDHEALLVGWQRAAREALHASVAAGTLQGAVGISLAVVMVGDHLARAPHAGAALLLVYWAVGIPRLGDELAAAARALPALQSVAARLFETLDAPVDTQPDGGALPAALSAGPIGIEAADLTIQASGQTLLRLDRLVIAPGERVAIVGRSGAGKSTLLGALLGWLPIASGALRLSGEAADPALLRSLRRRVAWVDPAVRIWNRSLLDNLRYGQESAPPPGADLLEDAELIDIVAGLPEGLSTALGADGGTLSGGQGQRVRLARAFARPGVGLVLLDEAFRGLDRPQRQRLLAHARDRWAEATLLCVTHDLETAADFPRVLVVDDGTIVEDGAPGALVEAGGVFASMLSEHRALRETLEHGARWRRWVVRDGRLHGGVRS